jgi:hypothetical protein
MIAAMSRLLGSFDPEFVSYGGHSCPLLINRRGEFGGPPELTSCPAAISLVIIAGSEATTRTSAAIRSRTSSAISRSPKRPTRPSNNSAGKPASITVELPAHPAQVRRC